MKRERSEAAQPASGGALLIDPSVYGQSHILVNTGFINIALDLYGHVTVVARDSHIDALIQYMDKQKAAQVRFVKFEDRSAVFGLYKNEITAKRYDNILFLNIDHLLYYKVNALNMINNGNEIYWVGHSHFLKFEKSGVVNVVKNQIKKKLFFNQLFNSTIIVCGQNIKKNIDLLLDTGDKVKAIFHPIGIDKIPDKGLGVPPASGNFSLLHINGWHEVTAGKTAAIESIKSLALQDRSFDFEDVKSSVSTDKDERYFSRDYKNRLEAIAGFSFFLHLPENSYRLQASGALMDMLLTGTPVIGLKTDFGEELKNSIGKFGYFFQSYDEIIDFLTNIDAEAIIADRIEFSKNLLSGYETIKDMSLQQAKLAFQ